MARHASGAEVEDVGPRAVLEKMQCAERNARFLCSDVEVLPLQLGKKKPPFRAGVSTNPNGHSLSTRASMAVSVLCFFFPGARARRENKTHTTRTTGSFRDRIVKRVNEC